MEIGRENEGLQDFLKLEDIMKQAMEGDDYFSKKQINYINQTLSEDKQALIKKLSAVAKISLSEVRTNENKAQIDALEDKRSKLFNAVLKVINKEGNIKETHEEVD